MKKEINSNNKIREYIKEDNKIKKKTKNTPVEDFFIIYIV